MKAFGLIVVAALSYYRLHYGVSVGDEAHYSAQAALPLLGGKFFVTEHTVQQPAAILVSPLFWLYYQLMGFEGWILFARHLHWFFSLVTAWVLYRSLKSICEDLTAFLLALLAVAFVPHAISSVSYNNLAYLLTTLAVSSGYLAMNQGGRRWAILSGVSWVLAGFSYPTMVAAWSMALVVALVLHRKGLFPYFRVWIGSAIASSIPLVTILLLLGPKNIEASVEYSKLFNVPGGLWKIEYALNMFWVYLPQPWILISLFGLWMIAVRYWKFHHATFALQFILIYLLFGGTYESMPTQVLWPLVPVLLVVAYLGKPFSSEDLQKLSIVLLPSIAGAWAACLSSRLTLYVMCLAGFVGAVFSFAYLLRGRKWLGASTAGLLLAASLYFYYGTVYEDQPIGELTKKVEAGPFAGLYTFPEKAQYLSNLLQDLRAVDLTGRTILFADLFPGGFLMSRARPLGPTLYIAPAQFYPESRPVYAQIFSDPKYLPDIVVELKYFPVYPNKPWIYHLNIQGLPPDPFREFFSRSGVYQLALDRPGYRFLVRK